jgi:hypothetical protein
LVGEDWLVGLAGVGELFWLARWTELTGLTVGAVPSPVDASSTLVFDVWGRSIGVTPGAPAAAALVGIADGLSGGSGASELGVAGAGAGAKVGTGDDALGAGVLGSGVDVAGGESRGSRVSCTRVGVGADASANTIGLGMAVGETIGDGTRGAGRAQVSSAKASGTIATSRRRSGAICFAEAPVLQKIRCIVAIRTLGG